ncbi:MULTISPECIES: trans-sulfuration enzyme family protein [Hungatella]|uniref:trans-sulfuration enzyme family protein n=1 Tax=Hungatella TaxID=1649459 RepID=UPI0006BEB86C|nr:PLP-dependent aspartate aminotransferase family protein [Hungatella hathewayi]CUQ19243.1 Cys/Met metabolism pyridoxal-phosphate-dependent protein [Hungatella hathewayi]
MTDQSEYLKNDKLITSHYGEEFEHYYNAVVPPIFMNSLNVFETVDDYYDSDKTDKHVYCYGRVQNPTVRILEDKAAALEQGTGALAFASGMAAATTAVLTVCKAKSHVVCIRSAYGPLKTFLNEYCREHLDMSVTYVKGDDTEEFEHAVTDQTDLIILESPSSVVLSLQDIHAVSEIAKKHHAYVYIDNSFCTPIYQKPLLLGADIVMHTASKYMGGHSDIIGGILAVEDEELMARLRQQRELFGGIIGPMEAWLIIRGLRTMEVRVERHQATAMEIAEFLESHPKVRKVYYPGLLSHPQHELMKRQQGGNTGLLSFEIKGSVEQAKEVAQRLKIFKIGVSWGGFESLVCMPHARQDAESCRFLGADQNVLRIHCGLEGAEVLKADLENALSCV